jgi:hypothetical protein
MIAPFFNRTLKGHCNVKGWEKMWSNILQQIDIDILALQDGIGCLNIKEDPIKSRDKAINNIKIWFKAMRNAIQRSHKKIELWSDLETFEQRFIKTSGSLNYEMVPASLDRIIRQIKSESDYVDKITSFSLHEYQDYKKNPNDYTNYCQYLKNIS